MESPFNFFNHEWAIDQRSSTPKSGRLNNHYLFHSNESAIMDMEHANSSVDRTKIKRRLFEEDYAGCGEDRPGKRILVEATLTARKMKLNDPMDASVVLNKMAEDPQGVPWTIHQMNAFFDAVKECGSNHVQIAKRMKSLLYARLGHRASSRSTVDVKFKFSEIVQQVADIMNISGLLDDEAYLRYMVINFGEFTRLNPGRRQMPTSDNKDPYRLRSLLKELICNGEAVFPIRKTLPSGEKTKISQKIYTPNAWALRQLHGAQELDKVPPAIVIHLRPRTTASLVNVTRSHQFPLLSIKFNPVRTVKHLFELLRRRWHIIRTEKKYLSAEAPELTLRPPTDAHLTWPDIMPDFRVLLQPNQLGWYSYDRFSQRFPHLKTRFSAYGKEEENRGKGKGARGLKGENGAGSENDSDSEEEGDSECEDEREMDVTLMPPIAAAERVYGEFFDENGKVAWCGRRHLHVPLAELYMIAGSDGKLILDYDWTVPDETNVDFLLSHFLPTPPGLAFFEALQISSPPCLKEETPKTADPPVIQPFHALFPPQTTYTPLVTEDITNSPPMFEPSPLDLDSSAVEPGEMDPMPLAVTDGMEGCPGMGDGGATLSEFLVMPSESGQVSGCGGQGGGPRESPRGLSVQIPNGLGGTTSAFLTCQNQQLFIITDPALLQGEASSTKVLGNISLSDLSYLQFGQPQSTSRIQIQTQLTATAMPPSAAPSTTPKSSSQPTRARQTGRKPKQPSAPRRPYRALISRLTAKET